MQYYDRILFVFLYFLSRLKHREVEEKDEKKQENMYGESLSDLDRSGHCTPPPPPSLQCSWPHRGAARRTCVPSIVFRPHTSSCTRSIPPTPATLRPLKRNTNKLRRGPRYTPFRPPQRRYTERKKKKCVAEI